LYISQFTQSVCQEFESKLEECLTVNDGNVQHDDEERNRSKIMSTVKKPAGRGKGVARGKGKPPPPSRRVTRGRRQSSSSSDSETENQPPRRGRHQRVIDSDSSDDPTPQKKAPPAQKNRPIARARRSKVIEEPMTSGEQMTLRENNSFEN
jgi:hypothetical protein